ncbi:hypothetical protein HO173_002779 [Letharia columbiana]|uniref:Uncharacterized protein n=1 Tax=Letharia columbiana TaxID=112416 RepID=A0A8H6L7V6_9LECA|nr:uncharacterized protein HO173_002779 [Letharia columbiana]KAF6238907.1 hypothetical protein HO173_002779 [Letharia columbiana]
MISAESQGGPNIALITIICSWTFLVVALLGVSLLIWARRNTKIGLGLDDYLTVLALATTIALVAQTTWAIADEGQDDHEAEISRTKFAVVVRSLHRHWATDPGSPHGQCPRLHLLERLPWSALYLRCIPWNHLLLCAICTINIQRQLRKAYLKRVSRAVHIDEENAAAASETLDEISLPMTEDNATQTHDRNILIGVSTVIHIDEENAAAASETPDEISLPVIRDHTTQTDRSLPWRVNGYSYRRGKRAAASEAPDEISLPVIEDHTTQTRGRSVLKSVSRAVHQGTQWSRRSVQKPGPVQLKLFSLHLVEPVETNLDRAS